MMVDRGLLERYLDATLRGDRGRSRAVVEEALQHGIPAHSVYIDLMWPVMVETEGLARAGRLSAVQEHLATRISRTIVDQLQNKLPRRPLKGRKVIVCCSTPEVTELGAQMMADLFESDGWEVRFVGGGLTSDDILGFVNNHAPDLLAIYGAAAKEAPAIRALIARIREINAWPDMRIMVAGGVFNRAEGLWEEIGADLFAESAAKAVQAASQPGRTESTLPRRGPGRRRKRRAEPVSQQPASAPH
ncbi:MAG: cobalamin B12-binding domain-containing protein [Planctomycetota bacterium]|jgi:methanogenic corrinoid protein MtbC1